MPLFRFPRVLLLCTAALATILSIGGCEQSMVTRSTDATAVLRDFSLSETPIPQSVLADAKAVAVLRETEAGLVVGAGGGKGVMVQRTADGWSAPIALDTASGSFGAQIGGTSRDVVLVFRSASEIEKVINDGGYSLAEASAAAGPSQAAAVDNDNPVQSFVRVSGLYAGARIGGVKFVVNNDVNHRTYGMRWTTEEILAGKVERPLGTSDFYRQLTAEPAGASTPAAKK